MTVPPNLPQDREYSYAEVIGAIDSEFSAACSMLEGDGLHDHPQIGPVYLAILESVLTGEVPERDGVQRLIDLMLAKGSSAC